MPFAQLVVGPPGSGKSTYCDGMHQFMSATGRPVSIVNLDPANDHTSYPAAIDIRDLIKLDEIMDSEELGPNGAVLYALEALEHDFEWLSSKLKELPDDEYIIFDCPGQVELFTHHASLRTIFFRLEKLGYRLVVIHLTDSYVLTQASLYISALLLALRSMLQMDLPHINVLTKIDNLVNYGPLQFNLDFYTEASDLEYLLPHLDRERSGKPLPSNQDTNQGKANPSGARAKEDDEQDTNDSDSDDQPPSKFAALNEAIVGLVEDFSLVSFETLAVEDKASMAGLLRAIDRAGGYAFGPAEGANPSIWQVAMREGVTMDVRDVQERWIDRREEWDDIRRKGWEEEGRAWREGGRGPEGGGGKEDQGRSEGVDVEGTEEDAELGLDDLMAMRGIKSMSGSGVTVVRKPASGGSGQ